MRWASEKAGNGKNKKEVNHEELVALLESKGVQLFDVREPKELETHGHIPSSVNIPCEYMFYH